MSAEVPMAPAATIGIIPFLYRNEYAVPRPTPAAQNRYCDNRLVELVFEIERMT